MTLSRFIRPSLLALAAASFTLAAQAAPLKVDAAKSAVTATFKQLNVPVDAKFKKFTSTIDFDAAKPAEGKASVEIDVASFDLGEPEYNKEVLKKEWFNAAQFPKATFVTSSIKPTGSGKFDVAGKLTIKGKSTDVSFPLTVKKEGSTQVFDGTLPIKRLTYNIGEGEWKDTGMVADEVTIKFHIVAQ
ncbi:YceI family protein [Herbaspirillum frisingense]|uniref:YceI family protein n=1 Tax=Herbaspirillum frisingense TaxID=92645 RepID=UPI0039B11BFA